MARARIGAVRAILSIALLAVLQGSTCAVEYCSGCDDDDDDDHDRESDHLMPAATVLRDPLGRPLSGPIPFLIRQE